ncbi:MAG: hypothetical protein RBR09_11485 [Desulfobulbaceae bacterium]|nr:hypothetical protein [Desulfobulbaceae bacterium]MDY0351867.1 hypothetical protein [Desulfobulbaceae bacterium]
MSMRKIALWVGLFSLAMGLFTYDSEVATAPVPVVTGAVVVVFALLGWIPEPRRCASCGRISFGSGSRCSRCGGELRK